MRPAASESAAAEIVYKLDKTSAPYVPTAVAVEDLAMLWGDQGIVSCIDGASGKLYWRERVGGNFSGSPVRVGERCTASPPMANSSCWLPRKNTHYLAARRSARPAAPRPPSWKSHVSAHRVASDVRSTAINKAWIVVTLIDC